MMMHSNFSAARLNLTKIYSRLYTGATMNYEILYPADMAILNGRVAVLTILIGGDKQRGTYFISGCIGFEIEGQLDVE
jgi:hypothetical protein